MTRVGPALVVSVSTELCRYCLRSIRVEVKRNKRGSWAKLEVHDCPAQVALGELVDSEMEEILGI